jgi:hypothetical protein
MNKTLALLLDSYRELNSKRLFWVTLILSGVVVLGMACVGLNGGHISLLGWVTPMDAHRDFRIDSPAELYKRLFSFIGVGFWLSFVGSILGLISTAGIFPDFMAGGSIDLYLSKPISRLRLFLTKYVGGLLFVTLQMSVFALASFLLLGIRGGAWEGAVFLSIPLVVLMFSYLFAFCVLLGVLTRSTIAAMMLTFLFWFVLWGVHVAQVAVLQVQIVQDMAEKMQDDELEKDQKLLPTLPETLPAGQTDAPVMHRFGGGDDGPFMSFSSPRTKRAMEARISTLQDEKSRRTHGVETAENVLTRVMAPLPKTTDTTDLLDRELTKRAALDASTAPDSESGRGQRRGIEDELIRRRRLTSAGYIIGTSVAFELAILSLAAWRFCRRDY